MEDQPSRGIVLPAGMRAAAAVSPVEPDIEAPSAPAGAARTLRAVLEAAAEVAADGNDDPVIILTTEVQRVLTRAESGETLGESEVITLQTAVDQATDTAVAPAGGGLLQAAAVSHAGSVALNGLHVDEAGGRRRKQKRNPFGRLAGLRISKKNYDRRKAGRFKKGFQRWIPHLTVWDATLRLVASEAQMRRRFKPGFVLDDELLGLTTSGARRMSVVYIHPDRLAQVVKAHKQRPLAIAAYLHGVACHELTHLDGRMGEGHSEEFVSAREDLGHATGHLLPAIAIMVAKALRLKLKPSDEDKRIGKLERRLARALAMKKGDGRMAAGLRREIAAVHADLAAAQAESARVRNDCSKACPTCSCGRSSAADRVLDAAAAAISARPPVGTDSRYVDAFLLRNRDQLRDLVQAALERRAVRGAP